MNEERRIQRIIDILSKNPSITSEEVDRELDEIKVQRSEVERQQINEYVQQWGRESEERVKNIVEQLDLVESVRITEPSGYEDREGKDLVVSLENDSFVFIQVKSSDPEVERFLGNKKRARRKMRLKKIIAINGRDEEEKIETLFLEELLFMDNQFRKKGEPVISAERRNQLLSLLLP